MADEKTGAERRYGKRDAEGSAAEERSEPAAEAAAEGDDGAEGQGMTTAETDAERQKADRIAMRQRHEKERRDLHGSHRQQQRDMAGRHEDEFSELYTRHAGDVGDGEGAAGGSRDA